MTQNGRARLAEWIRWVIMVAAAVVIAWFGIKERVALVERDVTVLQRQLDRIEDKIDWLVDLQIQRDGSVK